MSKVVDERVVEMRFDNKQFESNVKTSMSTLDKLKKSLKLEDASKGLENIDRASKNISFDSISSGVESLQKRFSTFGIVGMRIIENITDSMMRLANKTSGFLTSGIIQGGKNRAMNLENAHFQLQGLLKDEIAVAAVMKNVNDSVDGTAYSLDSAAKVASQFAATGMRAGDQMFHSLRAVAGVAAMTNSEYDEIGRIFTTVAGNGRLMGDQLLQLSTRGLNAAATLGQYLGKSEAEVRDMVSKGKLDFQTFAEAMDDAFGEHAKKANETFTGALSNIRAALARIGALFISPLIEQNGALVQLFNAIRQRINDVKNSIGPLADLFVKSVTSMANVLTSFLSKLDIKTPIEKMMNVITSKWDRFSSKLQSAGISMDDFQKKLTVVAKSHGISVDDLVKKYGSLEKVLSSGKISKNIIIETLKSFIGLEKKASSAAVNITDKLETFNKVTKDIINGNYGNGEQRVKALTKAGYEYATMQKLVNYIWERNGHTWNDCNLSADELTKTISGLSKEELKSIGYTEEQASKIRELAEEAEKTGTPLNELIEGMTKPHGKELIINSFKNALKGLSSVIVSIKNAWSEMVRPISTDIFTTAAQKIHSFSERLILSEENADKLKRTFKGLFSALDLIRSVVGGALRTAFSILSGVLSSFNINILDVTAYIGDAISKFRDWVKEHNLLKKSIDAVIPIIKSVIEATSEWIKNNQTIQNSIKNLISFLETSYDSISKWVDGLKETDNIPKYIISGFINGLKNGTSTIVNAMINLGISILNAIKGVLGIHSPSTEFFAIGRNVIQGFINGLKSGLSDLLSFMGNIGEQCINIFKKIDFSKLFAIGISGGIIYTTNKMLDVIKVFSAPFEGIGHMTNSIGGFFDALSESIKPNKWKNMSKTVLELAIAIGILSASVYALAQLETDKLWGAIGAIGALAAILGVLSFAVSKMNVSGGGFGELALVLVGVTAALYIMAVAIKKLEFLNEDNIVPILGGLNAMILGLVAIFLALSKLTEVASSEDINKAGSMILKISAAMLLMTLTIKAISMLKPAEIEKGIGCMALFGLLIAGLMAATRLAGKSIDSSGSTILKISAAMLLMVGTIKLVSGLEASEITKGIICMTLFGGLITGLMAATKLIGKNNIDKIGSAILGVSAAMVLMAFAIKIVAAMNPSEIAKGILCVTLFGGIIVGLMTATRLAGGNNLKGVAVTLLAASASIAILAGVAIVLSLIDLGGLAKGIMAVSMLSALMIAMIHATKGAQDCKGNIIAMTVAIGLMATSIAALSFIDTAKLASATAALSIIMGMFALIIKATSGLKGSLSSIGMLATLSLVVVGLASLLGAMAKLDIQPSIQTATSISILLLAMSASLKILDSINGVSESAIGSMALLGLVVAELGAVLGVMSAFNVEGSIQTATSISILLLAMSASLKILDSINGVSESAIGSMALLGLVVAELGVVLGAMAKLDIQPSIETATSISILLLAMSGALAILSFVGAGGQAAFVGIGALATLITALGGIIVGLGALVTYIPDMQTLLDNGIPVLEKIGYGLGAFFGNIAGGFLSGISSGFTEIAKNLSLFMINLMPFIASAKMIDGSLLANVETLAKTLLILTSAGLIEGIASFVTGGSSLDTFGQQLVPFGEAIKAYGDTVNGINTSGIQQSVDAGKALAELAKIIPNSGGLVGKFAGNNDIDDFAGKIVPFGKAIKEYGDAVNGINTSGIQQSVQAGRSLAELAKIIPNSGGLIGAFAGNNNIDDFGVKVVIFGLAIKAYGDTVNGINTSGIQQSVQAGRSLAELAEMLPNSGGLIGAFAGNNNIDDFGKKIVAFGKSLVDFSTTVSELNVSAMSSAVSSFSSSLSELGKASINNFVNEIGNGSSQIGSAAQKIMTSFINAVKSKHASVNSSFKLLISSITAYIRRSYSSFYNAGMYVVQGFANGISANTYLATAKASAMAKAAETAAKSTLAVNSPSKVFIAIGKSVGEGFEKGISDNTQTSSVISSTVGLAGKVISSARSTLGVNSPSRAFIAIGRYVGEGLALGIRNSAWKAVRQTKEMADRVVSVANLAFEDAKKWVENSKYFDELSLAEELEIWETIIEKYGEGTDEKLEAEKNAYSVYKELQKERYQNSKDWIDTEKEYNRLSLQEEYDAWRRIQDQYIEGTEERKEADKQVYRLKHELIDNSIDKLGLEIAKEKALLSLLNKETDAYRELNKEIEHNEQIYAQLQYEQSMSYIDDKDFFGRERGLVEELGEQWRVLTLRTEKGTDAYNKAKREVFKIIKEIYEEYTSYEEEKEKIQAERIAKETELEKEKADKEKEINDKLQSDIAAANERYTSTLESRVKTLYDSYKLFDEVKKKDPVNANDLMNNLQDQVDEFKDWQSVLRSLSTKGLNADLLDEFKEMGPSAISELKALNSMSDSQLQQYAILWSEKHKLAREQATKELENLRMETDTEIYNLRETAKKDLNEYKATWVKKMEEIGDNADEQLEKIKVNFQKKVGLIRTDTEAEFTKMTETVMPILTQVGENMMIGLTNGIKNEELTLYNTIRDMFNTAISTSMNILDEHSPSKVYFGIGKNLVQGLINGINNLKDKAVNACGDLGYSVINSASNTISKISDVISGDMEFEPTIRPVVDLSNVSNGIGFINGAFNANRSMNLSMAVAKNNQNGNDYQSELFDKMQEFSEKANGKLSSAIDALRGDFNEMTSRFEQMQIVLDSGVLVGELAPDMDSALGGIARMNRRSVR